MFPASTIRCTPLANPDSDSGDEGIGNDGGSYPVNSHLVVRYLIGWCQRSIDAQLHFSTSEEVVFVVVLF